MEYKSINQITQELKEKISSDITVQEVKAEFRKLGYLNKRDFPTSKTILGLDYKEAHDIRGKLYYKWAQFIVDEVGDTFFERYFPIR